MNKARIIGAFVIITASLLVLVGSFLPWERNNDAVSRLTEEPIEGPWALIFVAGIVILVAGIITFFLERNPCLPIVTLIGGLGCAAIAAINLVYISGVFSKLRLEYAGRSGGEGLYMVLAGGILIAVGSVACIIGSINEGKKPSRTGA